MTRILATLLLVGLASPAAAHLMPANNGTVSVKEHNVYTVITVPVSALSGFDDNGDNLIDTAELGRHNANLRTQIDARMHITADAAVAVEGLTFVVSALDGQDQDAPVDYVVAMNVRRFAQPPRIVEVWTDLFGTAKADRRLAMIATNPGGEERAVLSPGKSKHRFFSNVALRK